MVRLLPDTRAPGRPYGLHLPDTRAPGKPYGLHLQLHPVRERLLRPEQEESLQLSDQMCRLQTRTQTQLLAMFPQFQTTVELLFHPLPQPVLAQLSSSQVAALLYQLAGLLHSPALPTCPWADVALCAAVSLLYTISLLVSTLQGCSALPSALLQLQEQCARHYYTLPGLCWQEARSIHVTIWTQLILA